jgi:hypothetical protein
VDDEIAALGDAELAAAAAAAERQRLVPGRVRGVKSSREGSMASMSR